MYKTDFAIKWLKTLRQNHKNSLKKEEKCCAIDWKSQIQDLVLSGEETWNRMYKQKAHSQRLCMEYKATIVNVRHRYT